MKIQRSALMMALATTLVFLVPLTASALVPYNQDFENLVQTDINALGNDGWLVFGNVSTSSGGYLYGYGPFPAPNDGSAFSQIDLGQGGDEQGAQQLVVFSDYNNGDHAVGNLIESNVFQEQTISAADVGSTWKFEFQAKRGNLAGSSTAMAFIKTLDPANGYALTNLITAEMTAIPETWGGYTLSLAIDASLENQLLQIGFYNVATLYESSAIFYDNLNFYQDDTSAVPSDLSAFGVSLGQNYPNPFNPKTRIDFRLEDSAVVELGVYDLAGRRVTTLVQGSLDAGEHHVTWNGTNSAGLPVATGRYSYVLKTQDGQVTRSMILLK